MRKLSMLTTMVLCGLTLAVAQDKKFEVSPYIAGTLSEGVDVDRTQIPGTVPPLTIERVSPKNGLSWGVGFDYLASENFAFGFNFSQQFSKLRGGFVGREDIDLADMNVFNYHGTVTYNFGSSTTSLRPFVFGGLGATQYGSGEVKFTAETLPGGSATARVGETRFSSTWGGGVKFQTSENFGFRLAGRWTPTYIKTDPAGIWCDPYWWGGCWLIGNSQYSNQLEFSAGVIVRF